MDLFNFQNFPLYHQKSDIQNSLARTVYFNEEWNRDLKWKVDPVKLRNIVYSRTPLKNVVFSRISSVS